MQITRMTLKGDTGAVVEIEREGDYSARVTIIYTDRPREEEIVRNSEESIDRATSAVAAALYGAYTNSMRYDVRREIERVLGR